MYHESAMPPTESGPLRESLHLGLPQGRQQLVAFLQCQACEILRLPPARAPEAVRSLNELGFDSMAAMELRHRIEAEFGETLPPAEFAGSRTLADLADLVLQRLVLAKVVQASAPAGGVRDGAEEFDL